MVIHWELYKKFKFDHTNVWYMQNLVSVPADFRKVERKRKRDKFLDIAKELKKLWNMKMTVIPIAIRALG